MLPVILAVAAAAALIAFEAANVRFSDDETLNKLLNDIVLRVAAVVAVTVFIALYGCRKIFTPPLKGFAANLLWCVPCFLVCIVNFPFTALIGGTAKILRTDLIWLYALKCLSIGLMEEMLFRGLLQDVVKSAVGERKLKEFYTVAVTSAIFALTHLLNLFIGAGVGNTLLQIGYSFLIGAMLSAVLIKTENIWLCVAMHTLFDFGGLIIDDLGTGRFQDSWFWTFTAVAGVVCFIHIVYFLLKAAPAENRGGAGDRDGNSDSGAGGDGEKIDG